MLGIPSPRWPTLMDDPRFDCLLRSSNFPTSPLFAKWPREGKNFAVVFMCCYWYMDRKCIMFGPGML